MKCPTIDPRAFPERQLPNGSSFPDEGHLGAHNTDWVGTGFSTSQERGHGSGFGFHSDYVVRGAHDCDRAANYYRYRYTGNTFNCNSGGGGERLASEPGTFEQAHHADRAEDHRDGTLGSRVICAKSTRAPSSQFETNRARSRLRSGFSSSALISWIP